MDRFTAVRVFSETVKRGSISAAAAHLGISRAMASRYISLLEDWTGARLLHRTTRKLSLTVAGEKAITLCNEMNSLSKVFTSLGLDDEHIPKGKLKLTSNSIFAQYCLTPLLTNFLIQYPDIHIDLQIVDRTVDLAEEGIDLAIRVSSMLDPYLIARKLGSCSSVICATPSYLQRRGKPKLFSDLAKHNCLTYTYFGQSVWTLRKKDEVYNVAVDGNFSTNESAVLLNATLAGAGIAILPLFAVHAEINSGRLIPLMTEYEVNELSVSAVYLSHDKMPLAQRVLIDFLVENLNLP